ncbi:MAG: hypothetical protein QOJ68_3684 [Blastococcus sp.]|jgi:hypothetical protein|nr:hypothetical protein [Blastococcus sp.]
MALRTAAHVTGDDRVLTTTRTVAAVIIPFLVLAFVVLDGWPRDTARLFAWPIKPPLTPMILGSVYLGGAYFFARAVRATRWHTIKGGFPPVATFATLMGIATILHWEKFTHSHVAFWLWVGLYFTTPFLIAGVWIVNRRFEDRTNDDVLVPEPIARVVGGIGVLAAVMSAFLFLFPQAAIDIWPWTLTPLTARVMGAIFALGLAAVGAFTERRWSAYRLLVQVEMIMLALILVSGIRGMADWDPSNILTWLFAAGFVGVLAASVVLYLRMEQLTRERRPSVGLLPSHEG